MKRFRWVLVGSLLLSMVLAACSAPKTQTPPAPASGSDTNSGTSTTPAPNPAPKETITLKLGLGNMDSTIYLPIKYALNEKIFEKEGLQVEPVQLSGGAQVTQALVDGQADVAFGAMEHVLKYKQQGVDLMLMATLAQQPGAVLIVDSKYKDQIKSLKDLKGQKVGMTSIGSGSDTLRLLLLEKAGLGPKDVEPVGVGFDVPKAFADGKVVAAITYAPYAEELLLSGKGFMLPEAGVDLRTAEGVKAIFNHDAMPMVALMTHRQMLTKNPELVHRVVTAIVKAQREIVARSPEEIAKIVPAPQGISEAAYLEALKWSKSWLSPTGEVRADTVAAVTNALKHIKALPEGAAIDPASVIDAGFTPKS